MERIWRWRISLRVPRVPQVGHGAWLGAYFRGMVRTWGCWISMACELRGTWLGNHISQHASLNFPCQERLRTSKSLSASARGVVIPVLPGFNEIFNLGGVRHHGGGR